MVKFLFFSLNPSIFRGCPISTLSRCSLLVPKIVCMRVMLFFMKLFMGPGKKNFLFLKHGFQVIKVRILNIKNQPFFNFLKSAESREKLQTSKSLNLRLSAGDVCGCRALSRTIIKTLFKNQKNYPAEIVFRVPVATIKTTIPI